MIQVTLIILSFFEGSVLTLIVTLKLQTSERVEKQALERAVSLSQKSTASMGTFDKKWKDEPAQRKKSKV